MFDAIAATVASEIIIRMLGYSGIDECIRKFLSDRRTRHKLTRCIAEALERTSKEYPAEVRTFFDEHFLTTSAIPILSRVLSRTNRPTPLELAEAWTAQFRQNSSASVVEFVLLTARFFMDCLENYLKRADVFQANFDSISLDTMASELAAIRKHTVHSCRAQPQVKIYSI